MLRMLACRSVAVAALAGLLVPTVVLAFPGALPAASSDDGGSVATMEGAVVRQTNAIRRERGLRALEPSTSLARLAREHSCQMAREGTVSHTGPHGATLGDRVHAAGEPYRRLGENVAMNHRARESVTTAVRGWMQSEGHRANILDGAFTETGAGVCRAGDAIYLTQIFRRR